jgi:hypothetical protein
MALSLGAQGMTYLEPGHWQGTMAYRYLHTEEVFIGDEYHPEFESSHTNPNITVHSIDVTATYQASRRFTISLDLPFQYGEVTVISNRIHQTAGGLGDIRLTGSAWLLDPQKHPDGNVSLGLGLKAPTGDSDVKGHAPGFAEERPVDQAIQPGDGGWGAIVEMEAFQKLFPRTYFYTDGFYLLNPQRTSNTEFTTDPTVRLSIPDQYMGRVGLSISIWPKKGLSLTLGGRIDGIPVRDLIGGGDDGFRRPGYTVYIDPGIAWSWGKNLITVNGPVAVERNRERSIRDLETDTYGAGGLAPFVIIASYVRRF